ncbi:MAG: UDP-4-amino-4,6-dideoxy-N-acetyl-beta-L-altrosamine transaminase [Magnetococcales bacterium]|nr:UDP-4-amino-4,6-dideoxy-N-acetyl-beta-L-altrosamine transaminase [Magnetococcales bacterium]
MIPYGRQEISPGDIEAVVATLGSDWLTQGPAVPRFEAMVAGFCGARHGVAVNSATSALHLACLALGLGPGDRLWTSPNTFVASANCALYCGATVDFVDIDPRTYNMSTEALQRKLQQAEGLGCLPKIVVPVHFAGQSCDMQAIHALAQRYGFRIIEDASHAIGGAYQGQPIGDGRFADLTVFSFHPVKIVTTAEGGMVLTHQTPLYERMARLRSHGITRDPESMAGESEGPWYYEQIELGYNYRLTDIQAALGASQMGQLQNFVAKRRQLAARYGESLADLPLTLPWQHPDSDSAWHLYVVCLRLEQIRSSRLQVFNALRAAGIGVNVHYIPVHTQPYYRKLGFKVGDFPESERYYAGALSLPLFPTLTDAQQEYVVDTLRHLLT